MYTYHLDITLSAEVIEIPKNILNQDIQLFIKNKLVEYNQTSNSKVYIKSNIYYIFIYIEVYNNITCRTEYNRIDISK